MCADKDVIDYAVKILTHEKQKAHFGNAGAVMSLCSIACSKASCRLPNENGRIDLMKSDFGILHSHQAIFDSIEFQRVYQNQRSLRMWYERTLQSHERAKQKGIQLQENMNFAFVGLMAFSFSSKYHQPLLIFMFFFSHRRIGMWKKYMLQINSNTFESNANTSW
jgi:hypothetical protein